ncbi:hypothetical protein DFQ28_009979, partial [Apophysomyces sp. BC1034]
GGIMTVAEDAVEDVVETTLTGWRRRRPRRRFRLSAEDEEDEDEEDSNELDSVNELERNKWISRDQN